MVIQENREWEDSQDTMAATALGIYIVDVWLLVAGERNPWDIYTYNGFCAR
jgi:hypothetical protein